MKEISEETGNELATVFSNAKEAMQKLGESFSGMNTSIKVANKMMINSYYMNIILSFYSFKWKYCGNRFNMIFRPGYANERIESFKKECDDVINQI